jgi:hypothetical protein
MSVTFLERENLGLFHIMELLPPLEIERGDSPPRNQPLNYATKVLFKSLEAIFI